MDFITMFFNKKFWVTCFTLMGLLFGAIAVKLYKIDAIARQVDATELRLNKYNLDLEDVRVESRVSNKLLEDIRKETKSTNEKVDKIMLMLNRHR